MLVRVFAVALSIAALIATAACTQNLSPRASFAPEDTASLPDDNAAPSFLDRSFHGVPSTGSEATSPPPIPGSPPTALR